MSQVEKLYGYYWKPYLIIKFSKLLRNVNIPRSGWEVMKCIGYIYSWIFELLKAAIEGNILIFLKFILL